MRPQADQANRRKGKTKPKCTTSHYNHRVSTKFTAAQPKEPFYKDFVNSAHNTLIFATMAAKWFTWPTRPSVQAST